MNGALGLVSLFKVCILENSFEQITATKVNFLFRVCVIAFCGIYAHAFRKVSVFKSPTLETALESLRFKTYSCTGNMKKEGKVGGETYVCDFK